jgi:hypothetical protein
MTTENHLDYFNSLLNRTEELFKRSDIYKQHGEKWGYSVTATSFKKRASVVIGFNWGVDKQWMAQGNRYGRQENYPTINFNDSYKDLGSLKRTFKYFERYLNQIPEVQINYCFFRSEKENQVTDRDLNLNKELFDSLIEYLEPNMLISFSKTLNDYFVKSGKLVTKNTLEIASGGKHYETTKGKVKINDILIDYFCLPHPNCPIKNEIRDRAWSYCFHD